MIAYNFSSLCKEAEQYYYDLLSEEKQNFIPSHIVEHLNDCQNCSVQISRLRELLSHIEEDNNAEEFSTSFALLKLHFHYLGKPVNCEIVKPFLPGFLEPSLEIKIPSPITIHLDKCEQCQKDLETIRKYNLNGKQLSRLSQLFSAMSNDDSINCFQTQDSIQSLVAMNFSGISKEIIEHICICPDCRNVLYQHREIVRDRYLNAKIKAEPAIFLCKDIPASDYFDYVIPFGIDPANDEYAKFRSFFTSHSSTCPICLDKMQQMHNKIFGIVERTESGIITTYHIEEAAKSESVNDSEDIYGGFPIKAQLTTSEEILENEQVATSINTLPGLKKSAANIRPFVKLGLAAAAMILIGSVLLLNISPAKAVSLENIYKAIERIRNVHILSFDPEINEPAQEQWISRTFNVNLVKSEKGTVLWDIANKVKKTVTSNTGSVQTTALSPALIPEIQNTINGSFGLLPFDSISEIPNDAQWNHIENKNQENIEIHELIWTKKILDGSSIYWKCRIFTFKETNLPKKVEWYMKSETNGEYMLKSFIAVNYLDDYKMQKAIEKYSH